MKLSLLKSILVLGVICFPVQLMASPFEGKMSAVYGEKALVPSHNPYALRTLSEDEDPNVRFQVYVAGLGRLRFSFHEERALDTLPMVETAQGLQPDGGKVTLVRGTVQGSYFTSHSAGSVLSEDGELVLIAAFEAPRRLTERVSYYHVRFPLASPQNVTVKRVTGGMGEHSCAADQHGPQLAQPRLAPLSYRELQTQNFKELEIALDGDLSWGNRFGGNGTAKISQLVNEAELKYEQQLNVTFTVTRLVVNSSSIGNSDATNKLETYQAASNAASHFGTFDVAHLFTATDLNGGTIGLAYIGVICQASTFSYGISQYTNDPITAVTFAHELGHNFNAEHSAGGIMAATATNQGLDELSFTNQSLNEMQPFINGASCLSTVSGSDPTPTPTPTPDPGDDGGSGGGGGIGDGGTQIDLTLNASLDEAGQFSISVQAGESISEADDCFLDFVHAARKNKLGRGRLFASVPFSGTSYTASGIISSRGRAKNRKGNRIRYFLGAELFCNNNEDIFGFSAGQRVNAQRIKIRGRRLSPKNWFNTLGNILELSE